MKPTLKPTERDGQRLIPELQLLCQALNSEGINLHCIGAMSANQIINFTTQRGGFKNAESNEWFRGLVNKCIAAGIQSPTFVVHNVPAHLRLELLEE